MRIARGLVPAAGEAARSSRDDHVFVHVSKRVRPPIVAAGASRGQSSRCRCPVSEGWRTMWASDRPRPQITALTAYFSVRGPPRRSSAYINLIRVDAYAGADAPGFRRLLERATHDHFRVELPHADGIRRRAADKAPLPTRTGIDSARREVLRLRIKGASILPRELAARGLGRSARLQCWRHWNWRQRRPATAALKRIRAR